jgi:hypothetical protein
LPTFSQHPVLGETQEIKNIYAERVIDHSDLRHAERFYTIIAGMTKVPSAYR